MLSKPYQTFKAHFYLNQSAMTPEQIEDMDCHSPIGLFIETGKMFYNAAQAVLPFVRGAAAFVIPGALDRFNKPDEHQPQ